MSFYHHPHEIYDATMQQQQQQQQRVKVVAGYALQQRLGSGSFATVYKGIKISAAAAPTEQQQQQQQQRESSSSSMCDDDENDTTTTTTTTDVAEDEQQQQQQQDDDDEKPAEVAIKAISRTSEKLTKKVLQNLEIEISILRTYRHPNIVCMHDVTKTQQHFYLILEYCDGGDVQHLIRSRKSGRLSEKLARRLMRDLSSGLRFLWGQELIHRDIKPQNLLLTGRLPMEEILENPPSAATIQQDKNNPPNTNNTNYGFSLKIADFGFARHLQTASLAETLCGSPLYMAPEILQHHRYDAKADLWSVGTVLFEMIAGCPPFNGENHIDLLRNIQRKAVRLPPDVRISKACVNLLRILLNRNPLSRAGFKEFFAACDTLVALGCNGTPTGGGEDPDNEGGGGTVGGFNNNNTTNNNRMATKDLGTIHENDHQFHHGSGGGGTTTTTTSANNNMNPSSESLLTVATTMEQHQQQQQQQQHTNTSINADICSNHQQQQQQQQGNIYNEHHQLQPTTTSSIVSPNLTPSTAPIAAALIPNSINLYSPHHSSTSPQQQQQSYQQQPSTMMIRNRLSPLTSSPPSLGPIFHPPPSHHHDSRGVLPPQFPSSSHNMGTATTTTTNAGGTTQYPNVQQTWQQQQQQQQQPSSLGYYNSVGSATPTGMVHANSVVSQSQASVNDDSGFVMVEHTGGASPHSSEHYYNVTASSQQQQQHHLQSIEQQQQQQQQQRRVSKGMLGTSPGTGKMLLGMVGRAATIGFGVGGGNNNNSNNSNNTAIASSLSSANQQHQFEQQRFVKLADAIAATNKMIATAEDVGRRAVSVAHLGDGRAYLGMRLTFKTNEEGSSLLSTSPMEGVEEEDEAEESGGGTTDGGSCSSTSADIRDFSTHNSSSTEIMAPSTRRRRSSSIASDSNNRSNNKQMMVTEEPVEDEMPFAISPDAPSVSLPSRSNPSVYNHGSSMSRSMKKSSSMKANPQTIRSRYKEALSCYLKSLKMLKGAVGAAQRVTKDLTEIETQNMLLGQNNQTTIEYDIPKMKYRCEVTSNWLCSQFRGVLERADAANVEISKLDKQQEPGQEQEETANLVTTSVEELIYNHALASGRDGAVKHLLGQYEAARSCYRSAGLLAETLLMEVNIGPEDRKILEGYVDGFAARITELDQLMFQQSRMTISSNTAPSSRRGSGIVGLIGPPPVAPTAFITGSPR